MNDQKKKKTRQDKYEQKLKVNVSFEELLKISLSDKKKKTD